MIGLDVGGTKIAGAIFSDDGTELARVILPTPPDYDEFISTCATIIEKLDPYAPQKSPIGIGLPGAITANPNPLPVIANVSCLSGRNLQQDLESKLHRSVRLANDADCAALSEAKDGAAAGYNSVFGLILGTGVGGGRVVNGKLVQGANGLSGEFGHLPLPFRGKEDGPMVECACGQMGCIDKSVSGPGLLRLYNMYSGKTLTASPQLTELALKGDKEALITLDNYFTTLAKALITVLHVFDPDVVVVCGGLSNLPGLYEAVPRRWGSYALVQDLKTKFVAAKHGSYSGLRGAAWLAKADS